MASSFSNHIDDHRQDQVDALALLRKESLDLYNRVHSIAEDTVFVELVCKAYSELPVLPNLRCGAWYVNPEIASEDAAYFKSTDGHYNNWSFNLRRPNIHLLAIVGRCGGLVLVDSTRAGKRMPDALSKTVPIWCAVINRAIKKAFSKGSEWNDSLYTPPGVVPAQEHSQIEVHIDDWASALANSSYTLPDLQYPLRPLWITPATSVFPTIPPMTKRRFFPVICVSASKQIHKGLERRSNGFAYVQGSGDDHELWGMERLLRTHRADLPDLVTELVAKHRSQRHEEWHTHPTPISKIGGLLLISAIEDIPSSLPPSLPESVDRMAYVVITDNSPSFSLSAERKDVLVLEMPEGKKGQTQFLHTVLPSSIPFIESQCAKGLNVCICCHNGKDASVGATLAALQMFFDDEGTYVGRHASVGTADKKSLSTRLQWVIADRPQANPSRVTLKRVNEFLLTSPTLRR